MGVKAPLLFLSLLLANNIWSAYLSDETGEEVAVNDWILVEESIARDKEGKLPDGIPSQPQSVYKNKGWKKIGGWPSFLGSNKNRKGGYWPFKKARTYVIKLGFKLLITIYTPYLGTLIITWLMCFISLIYIYTIRRFYDELKNTDNNDLIQLRAGWQPRIIHFVF